MKNTIKSFILFFVVLFSSQNMANSVSEAVIAGNNNDNSKAVKIWSQLADTGNSIAKYNLASHYSSGNGVQKNELLADQWLKDAARAGLIEAYLNLNKHAISSAKGQTLQFTVSPDDWLKNQEPNNYTIQIVSSRNKTSIKKSFAEYNINGSGGYYRYIRKGVNHYALVYGAYKTVSAANSAIKNLPGNVRKSSLWVRKIKNINKIIK